MPAPIEAKAEPWSNEQLLAAMTPDALERPLIGSYKQFQELRRRGAAMTRFDILMHTSRCDPVRLPAVKALKWISSSKGFHFLDGPPHQAPPDPLPETKAPGTPEMFYCRVPGCARFFDSNDARAEHEQEHETEAVPVARKSGRKQAAE